MRTQITIEEHQALSSTLADMDAEISSILQQLSNRKGLKCNVLDKLIKVSHILGYVRIELENLMCREHRGDIRATTDVYFPRVER